MATRIVTRIRTGLAAASSRWGRLDRRWRIGAAAAAVAVIAGLTAVVVIATSGGGGGGSSCDKPLCVEVLGPAGDDVAPMALVRIRLAGDIDHDVALRALDISNKPAGQARFDHDVLTFRPEWPGFARGTSYDVSLALAAGDVPKGADPVALGFHFTTAGKLTVTSVFPQDGSQQVGLDGAIMVQFSRSVAALTVVDKLGPEGVLSFDPPVQGGGRWLNTSLYTFKPSGAGWSPSTTYNAKVNAALANELGASLAADYPFSFSTLTPKVVIFFPLTNAKFVAPEPEIKVGFNQPIDRVSAEAGFTLAPQGGGPPVAGAFEWSDDRTFVFRPARPLALATTYEAHVHAGMKAPNSTAATADDVGWTFDTIGLPKIDSTDPADGNQSANRYGVTIQFSNPMDEKSVELHITIEPKLANDPYFSWNQDGLSLRLGFQMPPSSPYHVTMTTDAIDRYGQHLVAPLDLHFVTERVQPGFSLFRSSQSGTFDAYLDPKVGVSTWNLAEVDFALYHYDRERLIGVEGGVNTTVPPPEADLVRRWSESIADAPLDKPVVTLTRLASPGGRLDEGVYVLVVSAPGTLGTEQMPFVVSSVNVVTKWTDHDLLVWAVDMQTGAALAGMPFDVLNKNGTVLKSMTTDTSGIAKVDVGGPDEGYYYPGYYVASQGGPDGRVALSGTNWSRAYDTSGTSAYIPFQFTPPPLVGYLYTDRPIYRPGETVYFKGVVRKDDDAHYSLPSAMPMTLHIRDSRGRDVDAQPVTLSDMGTVDSKLSLGNEAATGGYFASLEIGGVSPPAGGYQPQIAYVSFQVAEFKNPEFEVNVTPGKDEYVNGDKIDTMMAADLFFGSPLAGATVKWTVTSQPYFFRSDDFPSYSFSDYTPNYDYRDGPYYQPQQQMRGSGEGVTDAKGLFTFSVAADVSSDPLSQTFTLDATVTDQNGQGVAHFTPVKVHKGAFYLGMRADSYVATIGDDTKMHVVSIDPAGKVVRSVPMTVSVFERQWKTVRQRDADGQQRYNSTAVDTLAETINVTTGADGKGEFSFKPTKSGEYYVLAEAKDAGGNAVKSSTEVWVSSGEYASWRVGNDDVLPLVADKDAYSPGDTAKILVAAPFTGSIGLVTQERGRLMQYATRDFATNSQVIEVPITSDHVPNVFVGVTLFKAPTADNPLPQVKSGIVELKVSTDVKKLNIEIQPDKTRYQPRDTATYRIRTTNSTGAGVPAEVSLALVDKAVLSLQDDPAKPPIEAFWSRRSLSVLTGSSFSVSIDRANELAIRLQAGGKGGGGGPADESRTFFPNTAYWNASLRTGDDGWATVDVKLPDTLTTWRMTARGITSDTKAGDARNDIVTSKDLIIRPAVPRFLVADDHAALGAIVHNFTGAPIDVDVTLKADALKIEGDATQHVSIKSGEDTLVRWKTIAPVRQDSVDLAFEAKGGGKSDGVKLTLPLYSYFTPETVGTAGEVVDEASEAVEVPYYVRPDAGELTVNVAPSLAAGVNTAINYIDEYPYESSDLPASRMVAVLALHRVVQQLGLKDVGEQTRDTDALLQRSLQRLYHQQHLDGGWGWWEGGESDAGITAWVMIGLGEAKRSGYEVDPNVESQATAYLVTQLDQQRDVLSPELEMRSFMLYALARDGHGDLGRTLAMAEQHVSLSNTAKAWLALAIKMSGGSTADPRLTTLLGELQTAAISSATGNHWEEKTYDAATFGNSTQTTAQVLQAFTEFMPDHPIVDDTLRWLMVARKDGHWDSPHDTAVSLLSITDFMLVRKDAQADFSYRIDLNGETKLSGKAEAGNVRKEDSLVIDMKDLVKDSVNELKLTRTPGDAAGRLYYTARLRYYTPAQNVEAATHGIGVSHEYTLDGDASGAPVRQVQLGDVVKVKVTLIAPSDLNFVVLEDYLPAGLEPIDASLKTTSVQLQRKLNDATIQSYKAGKGYNPFEHTDIRDNRVALFARFVTKGVYEYTYFARATTPGQFRLPPANAYEQYFPEVWGRSDGGDFVIGGDASVAASPVAGSTGVAGARPHAVTSIARITIDRALRAPGFVTLLDDALPTRLEAPRRRLARRARRRSSRSFSAAIRRLVLRYLDEREPAPLRFGAESRGPGRAEGAR